jgi:hypothetical protein
MDLIINCNVGNVYTDKLGVQQALVLFQINSET